MLVVYLTFSRKRLKFLNKKPKPKKCKVCKHQYTPFQTTQQVCGTICAIELAKIKRQAKLDKEHRQRKRELKDNDRKFQVKKTQAIFNKYIRLRDKHKCCVSCSRPLGNKFDAGHYRSTGAFPELRFNELNTNSQCVHCNRHLRGNLVNYRINLIKKIGIKNAEWIEGPHEAQNYTIEDLKKLQELYKRKIKELEE